MVYLIGPFYAGPKAALFSHLALIRARRKKGRRKKGRKNQNSDKKPVLNKIVQLSWKSRIPAETQS